MIERKISVILTWMSGINSILNTGTKVSKCHLYRTETGHGKGFTPQQIWPICDKDYET